MVSFGQESGKKACRKFLDALAVGMTTRSAAKYAKIYPATFGRWLDRGKAVGPNSEGISREYYDFAVAYDKVRDTIADELIKDLRWIANKVQGGSGGTAI